ncbi:aldehyde dehydrogenase family protein [Sphingobacteriaceae bacterium]|nr:aldehyde dehydrogenase family protein [Sphingobacteriaceae bacterium]
MEQQIKNVFDSQQKNKLELRKTTAEQRITKLKILKKGIESYEEQLYAAMQTDLRKCRFETAVTELFFTYAEIDHAIQHLSSWMKPKSASANFTNFFTKSKIYYEPKGTCLIIAPWNYPFQLVMSPLISAIAAGNCSMLKPSELSPATSGVITKMIASLFPSSEIACFEGGAELSKDLLTLPFDHIFFTGSTAIGKIVMEAAAKNLTSVTLELGGKSPAIIDSSADLKKAAEKIAWGKLVNAGQTCIAPDYVLVHEKLAALFVEEYKASCKKLFFKDGKINKEVYGKIINQKQFSRLTKLIKDSVEGGAVLAWGGENEEPTLTILPTLLTQVALENPIMREEIFGPLLPVLTFNKLEDAISLINHKSKPLALYMFSVSDKNIHQVLQETSSGGSCINDVLVHIGNPNIPFGGVNSSGMGSSHGIYGFKNFSHERAVMFQSKFGITKMIYPPYEKKTGWLKWLKKMM